MITDIIDYPKLESNSHPTLNDTLELIKKHHINLDKTGDVPYFWHLVRVMLRINTDDENILHTALLHDIVEDTSITLSDLKTLGYNQTIIESVRWCSKNEFSTLTFNEWMIQFGQQAPVEAVLVKISDISDNLGFERMRGLMTYNKKQTKKSKYQYPLQSLIDKKTKKIMKFHGEMGVFTRYYKAWNFIFSNQSLLPLINQVKIDDFCSINDLLQLKTWLPNSDFNRYLQDNKLHVWTITGTVNTIKDKNNNNYLALTLDDNFGQLLQHFLQQSLPYDYILNQQKRDNNTFHITLINVIQYQQLIKMGKFTQLNTLNNQSFNLYHYGIGTSVDNKKDSQAWFSVLENQYLDNFREQLDLKKQHYHITLAFKNSDVFTQPKDRKSIVFDNNTIWKYLATPKNNKKLKF